jgi:K+ potassium transporter
MGLQSVLVATVNGAFLFVDLIFVAANAIKLIEGGWFPLLLAGVVALLMLTWRSGTCLLEQQRSRLRRREDEFVAWVLDSRLVRLPGTAAIFTTASSGIPLALTHHLRHNRVLHERVLLVSIVSIDAPRVDPENRFKTIPVGAGITRVLLYFGFMEHPKVMMGLRLASCDPALPGIEPEQPLFIRARSWWCRAARCPVWRYGASGCSQRCTSTPISLPPISGSRPRRSSRLVSKWRSDPASTAHPGARGRMQRTNSALHPLSSNWPPAPSKGPCRSVGPAVAADEHPFPIRGQRPADVVVRIDDGVARIAVANL